MKPKELSAEEMQHTNGGFGPDDMYPTESGIYSDGSDAPHPTSDGVGQTNESTYGTSDGPSSHHIP